MARKRRTISDQLREVIKGSGMTCYAISKATGVDQATLSRFMAKQTGLSTMTVDKLADSLGLELVVRKKAGKTKGN